MNRKHEQTVGTFELLASESSSTKMDMDSPKWNFALPKNYGDTAFAAAQAVRRRPTGTLPWRTQKCAVPAQPFGELRNQMCDQSRYAKHNDARTHTIPALSSKSILNGKCTADWHNYMQIKKTKNLLFRRNLSGFEQLRTDVAC